MDIEDGEAVEKLFQEYSFDGVVNLAAQAGVRYSLENPLAYINTNIVGFTHILEGCRHSKVPHHVYASSSSVYGANTRMPFSIHDNVDHPLSLYAASKVEPSLDADQFFGSRVIKNLIDFKKNADLIVVNRMSGDLISVECKVFIRDIYGEN